MADYLEIDDGGTDGGADLLRYLVCPPTLIRTEVRGEKCLFSLAKTMEGKKKEERKEDNRRVRLISSAVHAYLA